MKITSRPLGKRQNKSKVLADGIVLSLGCIFGEDTSSNMTAVRLAVVSEDDRLYRVEFSLSEIVELYNYTQRKIAQFNS